MLMFIHLRWALRPLAKRPSSLILNARKDPRIDAETMKGSCRGTPSRRNYNYYTDRPFMTMITYNDNLCDLPNSDD